MTEVITEYRNENTKDIDILSTVEMVRKMNEEDRLVALAVSEETEHIAAAIDIIAKQFLKRWKTLLFRSRNIRQTWNIGCFRVSAHLQRKP